jgi:hypothetical protein
MDTRLPDRMPEAEVSLRLAFWLFERQLVDDAIEVAIDGAQVQVMDTVHFDLPGFMAQAGWTKPGSGAAWQCDWRHPSISSCLRIHSNPGRGDVVGKLKSGHNLRVECKKGPLTRSRSSPEYPLLREALGQLLTVSEVSDTDILAVAVPHSPKFEELAHKWRSAPLIRRFGIHILTVDQSGQVFGFPISTT